MMLNDLKIDMMNSQAIKLKSHIDYSSSSIVSKVVLKGPNGNITLFAFDKNQELSEHTAPFDAFVEVVEGKVKIIIDKQEHLLSEGDYIIMPANVPHALTAVEKFKMLLTMIK